MERFILLYALCSAVLLQICNATTCFVCSSLVSNEDCNANGVLRDCRANEVCDTKISSFGRRYLITKRCTLGRNCIENCKDELCRTCCKSDKCNENLRARLPTMILSPASARASAGTGRLNQCKAHFSRGVAMRCVAGKDGEATACIFWCVRQDHLLRGPSRLKCIMGRNGAEWSGSLPVCIPKHLANPQACRPIEYDSKLLDIDCTDGFKYLSSCSFRCKVGYYMIHPTTFLPLKSSKSVCWRGVAQPTVWTEPPPRCLSKKCPIFVQEGISMVRCTNWIRTGSVCNFECLSGYTRVGPKTLTCLDLDPEGLEAGWNVTTPTCEPRECPRMNFPPNTSSTQCTDGNFFKSECEIKCADGYYLAKSSETVALPHNRRTSKCRVSSTGEMAWRPSPPVCIRKKCLDIPIVDRGYVECTDANNYMSTCSFSCDDAFLLTGSETVVCKGEGGNTKHGKWVGSIPQCKPKVCDPPIYNPSNLDITCSNDFVFESKCTFNCQVGYYMTKSDGKTFVPTGNLISHCTINKERRMAWSHESPICHLKTCEVLSNPDNGLVLCTDGNNHGSSCSFECFPGYTLNGRATLTCQESGIPSRKQIWNYKVPSCEARSCPRISYDDPTIDATCTDGILFGSICTFICTEGHYMSSSLKKGNSAALCILNDLDELSWSEPPPRCLMKTCSPLSNPVRGKLRCSDGVNFQSVCTFSCDDGYEPDGNSRLMCSDDGFNSKLGVWDTPPPLCVRRSCPVLKVDDISTELICENEFNYESECEFRCKQGHFMTKQSKVIDHARTFCDVNGKDMFWTEMPPSCEMKTCPELRNTEGGILKCSNGFKFGSSCTTVCTAGYSVEGHTTVQCESNGVNDPHGIWSNTLGRCKRRPCPNRDGMLPTAISQRCSDDNLFESICRYSCDDGYFMESGEEIIDVNLKEIECKVSGAEMEWSSELPYCKIKVCSLNGRIFENGVSTCQENATYGSSCAFSCRVGFDLVGSSIAVCEATDENIPTGVWNSDPPVCQRKSCDDIMYDPTLLQMQCSDGNKFESACNFSCPNGFYATDDVTQHFISNPNTTCDTDSDGTMYWTRNPPACVRKTCPVHSLLEHGTISCTEEYQFESTCTFACRPGFRLVGERSSTCIDNGARYIYGEWSSSTPKCQRRACPDLIYNQLDTNINCTISNFYESVCRFECNHGYYMTTTGDDNILGYLDSKCDVSEDDMFWTNSPPECQLKICPKPRIPEEGSIECNAGNVFASSCNFSCAPHRELSGIQTLSCEADDQNIRQGYWDYEFPSCELRSCKDWNIEKRAIVEECTNTYKYGSNCTFSCNVGHYVPEDDTTCTGGEMTHAQCGIKGYDMTWSGEPPNCKIKTCESLTSPKNGRFRCSDGLNWGTKCEFYCDRGYLLIGETVLKCEDDGVNGPNGTWNGVEPVCEERSCEALSYDVETQNANCNFGFKYSSVCDLRCKTGYYMTSSNGIDLMNNATAVCDVNPQNNRQVAWKRDKPKCFLKSCTKPSPPPDGLVTCKDGLAHGKRCVYACEPGFKMIGQRQTSCRDDGINKPLGKWSGNPPICKPKSCAKLIDSSNTTNFACTDGWKYRSVCTFSCNKGYFITEDDRRTIVRSGSKDTKCDRGVGDGMEWTDNIPVCLSKHCFAIRPKRNMTVQCSDKFRFKSRCVIKCDSPLRLVGPPVLTCMDDEKSLYSGKWSGTHWQLRCTR